MDFYSLSILPKASYTMTHKGFKASLMRAPRLANTGSPHGLPPGDPVPVYPIDMLPGAPIEWLRGPGNYICPVSTDWGLWFSWQENDHLNTAILPSVKGINPVTGQKLKGLNLEKYDEMCPIHEDKFKGDERFCEKCNYKWPPQSYVAAPNTLWWDGFRQPDGTVRQFFFTADEMRDVAAAIIGKDNTVPAFGFAFFEPKTRRQPLVQVQHVNQFNQYGSYHPMVAYNYSGPSLQAGGQSFGLGDFTPDYGSAPDHEISCNANHSGSVLPPSSCCRSIVGNSIKFEESSEIEVDKDVAVGAGAEIQQDLSPDQLRIDEWSEKPSSVIRLYFVFETQFKKIVSVGVEDLEGSPKGYLEGILVG